VGRHVVSPMIRIEREARAMNSVSAEVAGHLTGGCRGRLECGAAEPQLSAAARRVPFTQKEDRWPAS
jgi:hypothetical protein